MTDVVAALLWKEDRFLICKRPVGKARAGLWEFAGGKVEQGETEQDALRRECMEELGVETGDFFLFLRVTHEYPDLKVRLSVYSARIKKGEPKLLEHSEMKWISPEEIEEYDFCPADTAVLEKILTEKKRYPFYGSLGVTGLKALAPREDLDVKKLYDLLSEIWCEYTCAPRLREKWSKDNKTEGQCSITAFLTQDLFGGKVYGVPLPNGNFHCYNEVDGVKFDLTSEQFGKEKLCYDNSPEQFRDAHFSKEEKRLRYEYLKKELEKRL